MILLRVCVLSKVGTTPVSQMSRVMSAKETTHGSVNHNGGKERQLGLRDLLDLLDRALDACRIVVGTPRAAAEDDVHVSVT